MTVSLEHHAPRFKGVLQKRMRDVLQEQPSSPSGQRPMSRPGTVPSRSQELEYWSWTRKLRLEKDPHFKLPRDAGEGEDKGHQGDELRNKMAEKEAEYYRWLEKVDTDQQDDMEQRLAKFSSESRDRLVYEKDRASHLEEEWLDKKEQCQKYMEWVREPKASPVSALIRAPLARSSTPNERRQKPNRQASWSEYSSWVKSLQKPTGKIPKEDMGCLSPKQRQDAIFQMAHKRHQQHKTQEDEYSRWLHNVHEKHQERLLKSLDDQKEWTEKTGGDRNLLIENRTAELRNQQEKATEQYNRFVQSVYAHSSSMPLLVEDSKIPSEFAKQHNHRQRRRMVIELPGSPSQSSRQGLQFPVSV